MPGRVQWIVEEPLGRAPVGGVRTGDDPLHGGVTTSIYYRDPDGNFVEMQVDNFPDADDATAYMTGPEFEEDPVGVSFDPDKMIGARRAGTPVSELINRKWAVATSPGLPNPLTVLAGG
jgi:hypothetical protein